MAMTGQHKAQIEPPRREKGGRRGRVTPRGRQVSAEAQGRDPGAPGDRPRRRDLLIEQLHLIQDHYGHLSAQHLAALAEEMRLPQAEVYEVATFYAHFDVVREDETPPPPMTIRVCDSLTCELVGAQALLAGLRDMVDPDQIRVLPAPCMGRCGMAPVCEVGHRHIDRAQPAVVLAVAQSGDHEPPIPTISACRATPPRAATGSGARFATSRRPTARDASRKSWHHLTIPACAGSVAPGSRPGASGAWSAGSRSRAISASTPTRASPARSRTGTIWKAILTGSWRAC